MPAFEITFECENGDWRWHYIEAPDFQAAVENAMQTLATFPKCHNELLTQRDPYLGARLKSVLQMPSHFDIQSAYGQLHTRLP